MPSTHTAIIIPTYNERDNIAELFRRITGVLSHSDRACEILVVDDNSPDKTGEEVERLSKDLPITARVTVRLDARGLATAVLHGIRETTTPFVAVMDADLSHPPEVLPELLSKLIESGADLVLASRHTEGGAITRWPLHRQLLSRFARLLCRPFTAVSDPLSGFFAFRREAIDVNGLSPLGYKIALEIIARQPNLRIEEIPFTFTDRERGVTKFSFWIAWQFLKHILRLALSRKVLRRKGGRLQSAHSVQTSQALVLREKKAPNDHI